MAASPSAVHQPVGCPPGGGLDTDPIRHQGATADAESQCGGDPGRDERRQRKDLAGEHLEPVRFGHEQHPDGALAELAGEVGGEEGQRDDPEEHGHVGDNEDGAFRQRQHRCGDVEVDVPAARALERHDREQQREADHGAAEPEQCGGSRQLDPL